MSKSKYVLLFGLIFLGCSSENEKIIFIEINPKTVIIDKVQVDHDAFESAISKIVDQKLADGFKRNELIIDLSVHEEVKRSLADDIEGKLKNLNFEKIHYTLIHKVHPY
ncbi:MAG: hypothetical protein HOP08_04105 [Cyclobacteriaceae bacterium]|nr:hypothetical protein [Cyclobacteriaceae bacterium]